MTAHVIIHAVPAVARLRSATLRRLLSWLLWLPRWDMVFPIASLNLGQIRELSRGRHFDRVAGMLRAAAEKRDPTAEEADAYLGSVVTLCAAALGRDEAWVEAYVHREEAAQIVNAVLRASGMLAEGDGGPNAKSP
jgi:hypothetical protein